MKNKIKMIVFGLGILLLLENAAFAFEQQDFLSPKMNMDSSVLLRCFSQFKTKENPEVYLADLLDFVSADVNMNLALKISQARTQFAKLQTDKASDWPKFFLSNVLEHTTEDLQAQMNELILWMDSEIFEEMEPLDQLEYIEYLAQDLSPFEKLLFYEGVYFVSPKSGEIGFNINTKQDWGLLYFFDKTLFAHGSLYEKKDIVELTFGDDLYRKSLRIKHVHLYAYMKKLADAYVEHSDKKFEIANEQLFNLASYADDDFLQRALKFYLVKVGGFKPVSAPKDAYSAWLQSEFLSQLKNGLYLTHQDAAKIVDVFGLSRDFKTEQEQYLKTIKEQEKKDRQFSQDAITSRDIIYLEDSDIRKIWDEKYPVKVEDKTVYDNLGYCAGAVFSKGDNLWFRRYGESPDIMQALEKDLNQDNADQIFEEDTKVVLMSSSYGSWRWDLENVKQRLVKKGLKKENIVILDSQDQPSLDGISIYLNPDRTVTIHRKNHSLGVIGIIEFKKNLTDLTDPRMLSRFEIEDLIVIRQLESQASVLPRNPSGLSPHMNIERAI